MIMHRTEGALVQNVIEPTSPDDQPDTNIYDRKLLGYSLWKWIAVVVVLNITLIVLVVCVLTIHPPHNAEHRRERLNTSSPELNPHNLTKKNISKSYLSTYPDLPWDYEEKLRRFRSYFTF